MTRADGGAIVVCESGRLVSLRAGAPPFTLATRLDPSEVSGAVALLDDDELAVASVKGHLTIVHLGVEVVRRFTLPVVGVSGLAAHGGRLLVSSPPQGARVVALPGPLSPPELEPLAAFPRADADAARWDGDTAVLLGLRGVTRWSVPPGQHRAAGRQGDPGLAQVRAYGDRLLLARGDGAVRVDQGAQTRVGIVASGVVKDAALSADGRTLYAVSSGVPDVQAVPVDALPCGAPTPCPTRPVGCARVPLRRVVALATGELVVSGWDPMLRCAPGAPAERVFGVARDVDASPDRTRFVALGDPGGGVLVGDRATQRQLGSYEGAVAAAIGDDGEVAVALADQVAWLSADGSRRVAVPSRVRVTDVALRVPDRLVTGGFDGVLRLYDGAGALVAQVKLHAERISSLAVVPGGLWSASWDGTARRVRLDAALPADDPAGLAPSDVLQ